MTDSTETLRVFANQRFISTPIPPWVSEAIRLSCDEKLDWAKALSRVLDAEEQGLTVEPMGVAGIEINFWRSPLHGVYVEIGTPIDIIEQVLIPDDADWLPFMTAHLTPLLAAIGQMQVASEIERLTNALIAFARHGEGDHIDRSTGHSRIDVRRDERFKKEFRSGARARVGAAARREALRQAVGGGASWRVSGRGPMSKLGWSRRRA